MLYVALGGAAFLGALWLWPHRLSALCLVAGSVLLTLGSGRWRSERPPSPAFDDNATTPPQIEPHRPAPSPARPATPRSPDAENLRRDLVANVSHELKTPLTAIRGYAESLEDGALDQPEVARRFTARILEQCGRLEALLRDLLTLSWLENDPGSKKHQAVDLATLLHDTTELLAPRAEKSQVKFTLDVAEEARHCLGDPDELERMLLNLLENSIKYNRQGGTVRLRLRAAEEQVLLEVEDTGIGIPKDDIGHVFERFYRVDKGRSRDQGGTGLGLAIVKHVVRGHGGRIEVSSRLSEGSCFRVWLPAFPGLRRRPLS